MLRRLRRTKKAQGATEYAIFIAAVLAGLLALQVYYSRSVKGNMKGRADSIGEQLNTKDGYYNRESMSVSSGVSSTNTGGEQGGAWSSNRVGDGNNINGTAFGGFRSKTSTGGSHSLYSENYSGGSISSTKYVGDGHTLSAVGSDDSAFFNTTTHTTSTGGTSYQGDAEARHSVWDDGDL